MQDFGHQQYQEGLIKGNQWLIYKPWCQILPFHLGFASEHILPNGGLTVIYMVQSVKNHLKQIQIYKMIQENITCHWLEKTSIFQSSKHTSPLIHISTLLGPNISPTKALLKMIFRRWDMLVPWSVFRCMHWWIFPPAFFICIAGGEWISKCVGHVFLPKRGK